MLELQSLPMRYVLKRRLSALTGALDDGLANRQDSNFTLIFQTRSSVFDRMSDGGGVFSFTAPLSEMVKAGVFIDYSGNLTTSRMAVDTGDAPMTGAFFHYGSSTSEGLQARLVTGFDTRTIRAARDTSLTNTEAGTGKSRLNSMAVMGELGWGIGINRYLTVMPYASLRYGQSLRKAYREAGSTSVTSPLTYSDFFFTQMTTMSGIQFAGYLTDNLTYKSRLGVEYDIRQTFNAYTGSSAISGLERFSVDSGRASERVKPTAYLSLSYALDAGQALTASVSMRGMPNSQQGQLTSMAGYQLNF